MSIGRENGPQSRIFRDHGADSEPAPSNRPFTMAAE
jgi:hypothetical protein